MWRSVLTRLSQSRSLTTTSHNLADYKGASFSDTDFERKRKKYGKKSEDFDYPQKSAYSRDFNKINGGYSQRSNHYAESRHTSFDADDEDFLEDRPVKPNRYSYKKDSYTSGYRNEEREKYGEDKRTGNAYETGRSSWEDRPTKHNRYMNKKDSYTSGYGNNEGEEYGEDRRMGNANLSEIGTPSKWKVGQHFLKESDRLRDIQNQCRGDFKKMAKFTVKRDPGIRRQTKALGEFSNPNELSREEDFDDEVNVMKFDKMYDETLNTKQEIKELVKMKIIKQKYFKDSAEEKTLSWSDKEHIRFLHNSDPDQWTFEMIAEHFRIEPHVAKAIATAKWIPHKPKSEETSLPSPTEIYPLANIEEQQQEITKPPLKSRMFKENQRVTLQELKKDMGLTEESIIGTQSIIENDSKPKRTEYEPEDVSGDKDLVLQYLSGKSPSKWASQESNPSESKITEEVDMTKIQFREDGDIQQVLLN